MEIEKLKSKKIEDEKDKQFCSIIAEENFETSQNSTADFYSANSVQETSSKRSSLTSISDFNVSQPVVKRCKLDFQMSSKKASKRVQGYITHSTKQGGSARD